MDFHTLSRKELQTLCKKNKIPANLTNVAMANALGALDTVDGIEEFLNRPELESPRTTGRTATRRNSVKQPESSQPLTRTRRATARKATEVTDQENKDVNVPPQTPAVPITRRRAQAASARRKLDIADEEKEKNEEVKYDDVQSTQKKKAASVAVRKGYSTRRSVKLLEKTMADLKLTEPIKMDEETLEEGPTEKINENEESGSNASRSKSTEEEDAVDVAEDLVLATHKGNVEDVTHKETEVVMNDNLKGEEEYEVDKDGKNSIKVDDEKCNDENMSELQENKGDCEEKHECMKADNVLGKEYEIVKNENTIEEADEEKGDFDEHVLEGEIKASPICDDLREDENKVVKNKSKVVENKSSMEEADENEVMKNESSMGEADEKEVNKSEGSMKEAGENKVIMNESSMEEADEKEVVKYDNSMEKAHEKCKFIDKTKGGDYENVPKKETEVPVENLEEEHKVIENESSIEGAEGNEVIKNERSMEEAAENEVVKDKNSMEEVHEKCKGVDKAKGGDYEDVLEIIEVVKDKDSMEEVHEKCKGVDKAKGGGDYENVLEMEIEVPMENLEEEHKVDEYCNGQDKGEGNENVIQNETEVPINDNNSLEEEADEKCGENTSVLQIDYDGKLESKDAASAKEGSIVADNLMSSPAEIPVTQTDELENEVLIDVEVTESEDFAIEAYKSHPSAEVCEWNEIDSLYDVYVTPEAEFAGENHELPPLSPNKISVIQKVVSLSHPSPFTKGLAASPLTAERLPQFSCHKSSAKRESTVRRRAYLSDNKEILNKNDKVEQNVDKENKSKEITKENSVSLRRTAYLSDNKEILNKNDKVEQNVDKENKSKEITKENSVSLRRTAYLSDNKEILDKSDKVEKHVDKENKSKEITRENSVSLDDKSLRQLKKMFKEKLTLKNNEKDITQAGKARQALQALPSNIAAKETETN